MLRLRFAPKFKNSKFMGLNKNILRLSQILRILIKKKSVVNYN